MKLGKLRTSIGDLSPQSLNITRTSRFLRPTPKKEMYPEFTQIDGRHPLKEWVPEGHVDYPARLRHGGKVSYFNFALAKEMGLIPASHPHCMNDTLERSILQTFSITIINEYDLIHQTPIPEKDFLKDRTYMATRYLQLQHPDKKGHTSGDGRSIWNGHFKGKNGRTWDISSCGTGATCLSPATAIEKKFFRTGDPHVSYGCGHADLSDGFSGAIMSEIFHRSGTKTERTLAVVEFSKDLAINVRAYPNLMRPSHLFYHLKQNNHDGLKRATDYYIQREMDNGHYPKNLKGRKKYLHFLQEVAKNFATSSARFENEYIFCWLDWDGDNVLMDGGIIDYGSVRQFGLYHHEYRYDDVDRFSTTIPEQKFKARYIVQTIAQIVDFILTGKKKNIKRFKDHPILKKFDQIFDDYLDQALLDKIGFNQKQAALLFKYHRKEVKKFRQVFSYFEKAKSVKGKHNTVDGITWDAIFCMRDILREFPLHLQEHKKLLAPEKFLEILCSQYACPRDLKLNPYRRMMIDQFQNKYVELIHLAAGRPQNVAKVMLEVGMRSSVLNRYERITGDAIIYVADELIENKKSLSFTEVNMIIEDFVNNQVLRPEKFLALKKEAPKKVKTKKTSKILKDLYHVVRECREGI